LWYVRSTEGPALVSNRLVNAFGHREAFRVSEIMNFPGYANGDNVRLLNLGCGQQFHSQWTNLDIHPADPHVMAWDLQKDLPFPDASFHVVYHPNVLNFSPQGGCIFSNDAAGCFGPESSSRRRSLSGENCWVLSARAQQRAQSRAGFAGLLRLGHHRNV